jgi:plastocyanin
LPRSGPEPAAMHAELSMPVEGRPHFRRKKMKKTKDSDRRGFLKATGGALIAAGSIGLIDASAQHHKKASFSVAGDPLGSATVSFGGWMANFTPPLDRFTSPAGPPPSNHHELIPNVAKIKAGGYVNFVISGLHVVTIYDDGTKPSDIDPNVLIPLGGPLPPVINDANRRIYRGVNPVINPGPPPVFVTDRVEVVHFEVPGTYLVICGVRPHFMEGMFGYVRVLSGGDGTASK